MGHAGATLTRRAGEPASATTRGNSVRGVAPFLQSARREESAR